MKQNEAPTTIHRQNVYGKKDYSAETIRVLPIIDQWLEEDLKHWHKHKHTAARIFKRLEDEYDFKGSASNIRKIVAKRRKKLQESLYHLIFNSATNSNSTGERRILFYRVVRNACSSFVYSFPQAVYDL